MHIQVKKTHLETKVIIFFTDTCFFLIWKIDSPLQIAVLNLFVQLQSRFQNMVTGVITRDSIRNALIKGITAEQIIFYMQSHAHSQMRKKVSKCM